MMVTPPPAMEDTPAIHLPYQAEAGEVTREAGGRAFMDTGPAMTGEWIAVRWDAPPDLTGAPRAVPRSRTPAPAAMTPADAERGLRNRLLARKYARSRFTREDDARLEILNERLRAVMRRVREEDLAALEATAQQIEGSRELRKQIEAKYGL